MPVANRWFCRLCRTAAGSSGCYVASKSHICVFQTARSLLARGYQVELLQ